MSINGTVKWFNESKGFGFITSEDKDFFVHFKSINTPGFKTLKDGQQVEFNPVKGVKGMEAQDVRVL